MATDAATIDFLLEQAALPGRLSARKMFGEYAVYLDGKVVALVCDNQYFLKPTGPARALLASVTEWPPYPGAKPHWRLDGELEDRELLRALLLQTALALPAPAPKAAGKRAAAGAAGATVDARAAGRVTRAPARPAPPSGAALAVPRTAPAAPATPATPATPSASSPSSPSSPSVPASTGAAQLLGVDFTCAPSRRKPITVARGRLERGVVRLEAVDELLSLPAFEALLREAGPWSGAFDFPFGLPRAFVDAQSLGADAASVSAELHRRCATRMDFRALVDAWGNTRPAGQRLVHRQTDQALQGLSSTSPLQTRYVPVGFMYYEGFSRLLAAGVSVPGLAPRQPEAGQAARTAWEGYPAALAHELIGARSYKNSDAPDRLIARKDIVDALEQGRTRLGLRCRFSHAQRDALTSDISGDRLDAVLCLVQAAWATQQPGQAMPAVFDPVEGWILSAGMAPPPTSAAKAPAKSPRRSR